MDKTTNADIVVQFGQRIWGSGWAVHMGDLTGINFRTLTRIHAAARDGREYAAARGVIAALYDKLAEALNDLEPWARRADGDAPESPADGR